MNSRLEDRTYKSRQLLRSMFGYEHQISLAEQISMAGVDISLYQTQEKLNLIKKNYHIFYLEM